MTDTETKKILAILRAAYPAFYSKMGRDELYGVVNLWQEMFTDVPYDIVTIAVKSLIKTHSGYPPDIAAVNDEINNIVSIASGEPTDEELWNVYKRAVQESGYCERETFDKLPPILQQYCGNPGTLHEHAMMKLDTFLSVLHGQFLKQLPIMRKRQKDRDLLPDPVKQMISDIKNRMELPPAEQCPIPQDFNDKRNKVISQLIEPVYPKTEYKPLSDEETQKRKQEIRKQLERVG